MRRRGLSQRSARAFGTLLALVIGGNSVALAAPSAPASRYASIVLEADTGAVLYERNADLPRSPASLTKIMTLYMAFEALAAKRLALTDELTMSAFAVSRDPSRLDLAPGSRLKVEDAIRAMTTKSANDAACAIAERLGKGSETSFAEMMTAKGKALGLTHTVFHNASGLPSEGHISSARDLAILSRALVRDYPTYYHYFSDTSFEFHGKRYPNQNRFLRTYYGADGIKTGFVNDSGHNLAASATRGGKRLIAVVLGGDTQAWTREHASRLLDTAYAKIDPSLVMVASNATGAAAATTAASTVSLSTVTIASVSGVAATAPATAPAGASAAAQPSYATPAGAVTVAASDPIPMPNGTANLLAYAAAASAPKVPSAGLAKVAAAKPAETAAVTASAPPKPAPAAAEKPAAAPAPPAPTVKPQPAEPSARAREAAPAPTARAIVEPAPAEAEKPARDVARATVEPAPAPTVKAAPREMAAQTGGDAQARPAVAAPVPAQPRTTAPAAKPAPAPAAEAANATAKPAESVTTNAAGGDWSVQVGLFRDATVARRRGEEARRRMPLELRGADLVVDRAVDGIHVTSRISRLSEQEARAACTELQRSQMPCVVVPPGRPMVVATN